MELQSKQLQQNNPAFVLGNGKSRLTINSKNLLDLGTVYACNAVYRELEPHYLIAVDVKMINEIVESGYHKTHEVWTNPNKGIKDLENLKFFNPHKGWSSGPTALWLSASKGHREIYILGFDYQGIQGKVNNVYADTRNYKSSRDTAIFFGNWLNQTYRVIREYQQTKFYRVMNPLGFIPDKLKNLENLEHITYEKFEKIFPLIKTK
jgi:hypothetical protein